MTIYLLGPELSAAQIQSIEKKLKRVIPDLRKIGSIEDIAHELSDARQPKVVIIVASPSANSASIDNLIAVSSRYRDRVFCVLVSKEISASDYKGPFRKYWRLFHDRIQMPRRSCHNQKGPPSSHFYRAQAGSGILLLPSK